MRLELFWIFLCAVLQGEVLQLLLYLDSVPNQKVLCLILLPFSSVAVCDLCELYLFFFEISREDLRLV